MAENNMYNGINPEGAKAISNALELSAYEHKKLERHQRLSQLADEDVAYTIRRNVDYLWADYYFEDAQKWLSIKATEYDKRKKYPEKEAYEFLVDILKKVFQVEVLEIFSMSYEGYEQYTRWVEFTTDSDYVFHMTVPVVKRITTELMSMVNYGKITLGYYRAEHTILTCGASYNLSELKPIMDEILSSEGDKKHWSKTDNNVETECDTHE